MIVAKCMTSLLLYNDYSGSVYSCTSVKKKSLIKLGVWW